MDNQPSVQQQMPSQTPKSNKVIPVIVGLVVLIALVYVYITYFSATKKSGSPTAIYLADVNKELSTQNTQITYRLVISSSGYGGSAAEGAFYKLGNESKFLIASPIQPINLSNFQEYTEVTANGSIYQCTPPASSPNCQLLYSKNNGGYYREAEFGFTFSSSEPINNQLLSIPTAINQSGGKFNYINTINVAGRPCDLFSIQNSTINLTICLDQDTGFPLINNVTQNINGQQVSTIMVAQSVSSASSSNFYP